MNQGKPSQETNRALPVGKVVRPTGGWLRSVRDNLGITLTELANRLKVTPPAVRSFEQAEAEDRITLASLRRAAAAMDCDLVYALVSRAVKPAKSAPRSQTPVKPAKPVPPPETGRRDDASFVTDLTRHTEYGDA
jgi:transcriptional regulator with XRE-family HTH domain